MRDCNFFTWIRLLFLLHECIGNLTVFFRQNNTKESRVLRPLKPTTMVSECNISKASESKWETDGDLSDSKTLAALEMLKEEDMDANWSTFRKYLNDSQTGFVQLPFIV